MKKNNIIISVMFLIIGIIVGLIINSFLFSKTEITDKISIQNCQKELQMYKQCDLTGLSNICYNQGFKSEKTTLKKTDITNMISYDRNSCLNEYKIDYKSDAQFCIVEHITQLGEIVCRCWA